MIEIKLGGMTCSGCVRSVEKAVKAATGASEVAVDLERSLLSVPDGVDVRALVQAIEAAGFSAEPR